MPDIDIRPYLEERLAFLREHAHQQRNNNPDYAAELSARATEVELILRVFARAP